MAIVKAALWPIDVVISYFLLFGETEPGPTWYGTIVVGGLMWGICGWLGSLLPNLVVLIFVYLIGAWIAWKEDENGKWWFEFVSYGLAGYFWVSGIILLWQYMSPS